MEFEELAFGEVAVEEMDVLKVAEGSSRSEWKSFADVEIEQAIADFEVEEFGVETREAKTEMAVSDPELREMEFEGLAFGEVAVEEMETPRVAEGSRSEWKSYADVEIELAIADFEAEEFGVEIREAKTEMAVSEPGLQEVEFTEMAFGDLSIDEVREEINEIMVSNEKALGKELDSELSRLIGEFEFDHVREAPSTDSELAAADIELQELLVASDDTKIEGGLYIEDPEFNKGIALHDYKFEEYEEFSIIATLSDRSELEKNLDSEVKQFVAEFEAGSFRQEPNIEEDWAMAEFEVNKIELAVQMEIARVENEQSSASSQFETDLSSTVSEFEAGEYKEEPEINLNESVKEKPGELAVEPVKEPIVIVQDDSKMPLWFKSWLETHKEIPPEIEEYTEVCCAEDWNPIPWPKWLSIRHLWGDQENDCIPFATNYTTVELLFAPDYCLGSIMPFLDVRGHRFDNNTYAANGGLGGRYIPDPYCDCFCEMLGFNAYYDYRQGCIGYYNQVGVGLEILSRRWDLRANAYAPFGKKRHIQTCVFDDYIGDYFAIRESIESISYSFNAELGWLIIDDCYDFSLYAAAGPYFIARAKCNEGVVGGEARIRPQYRDYLALDLSWRYDQLFETIWQVEIVLNLPLYQISCKNKYPCGLSDRQIYQPIERFEVMPLSKRTCWHTNF
jgi:hypothetical protein